MLSSGTHLTHQPGLLNNQQADLQTNSLTTRLLYITGLVSKNYWIVQLDFKIYLQEFGTDCFALFIASLRVIFLAYYL